MLEEYRGEDCPPLHESEIRSVVASLEERLATIDAMIADADGT